MNIFLPSIYKYSLLLFLMWSLFSCKSNYSFQDVEKKNIYFVYKLEAIDKVLKHDRKPRRHKRSYKINVEVNKLGFYSFEFKEEVLDVRFKTKEIFSFKKKSRGVFDNDVFLLNGLEESFCSLSYPFNNVISCRIVGDKEFYLELLDSLEKVKGRFRLKVKNVRPWKNRNFRKYYVKRALL